MLYRLDVVTIDQKKILHDLYLSSRKILSFGNLVTQLLVNSFHHYLEGVNEILQYYFKTEDKKLKIPMKASRLKQTTYHCMLRQPMLM